MIITRTPFRISFVGGGSDMPDYYRHHDGAVLSVAIDKYMYLSTHPHFEPAQTVVKYSQTEKVSSIDSIQHPIVREALRLLGIPGGLEISSNADIPSGTGLGSSSAFTVGLLQNLYAHLGIHASKNRLAADACRIEIEILKEPIGKQDQYASASGGMNVIRFLGDETVRVEPVILNRARREALQERLVMFYLGSQRSAADVLTDQKKNLESSQKRAILEEMVSLVEPAHQTLMEGDLADFGRLLHRNWELKQKLSDKVSNQVINAWYAKAMEAGAIGGKLLGAGGGGFLLFYREPEIARHLESALAPLRPIPFRFDHQGSSVIYVDA
ncbi:MAG: GHMP kinase [Spirochaetia bacterium]|nr:GHMP kinase [Spirochaetia bacterium]